MVAHRTFVPGGKQDDERFTMTSTKRDNPLRRVLSAGLHAGNHTRHGWQHG